MLVDAPHPGLSYVLLYLGLAVFLVMVPIFLRRFRKLRGVLAAAVFVVGFGAALVFLVFLYAGFTTRYTMDSETLTLRSGFLAPSEVKLFEIKDMQKVPTNWQALIWALNRTGYCNRFANGVRLATDRAVWYLSPSNPDQFIEEIRTRQRRSSILRKNLVFH